MILNAYAVLDASLSALRLLVGLLVLGFGSSAWLVLYAGERRQARGCLRFARTVNLPAPYPLSRTLESRAALLFLLAFLLVGLDLAAWPVLYWLLQSYVPEWPGVMCIYGVMQVGTGSLGPSRFLPALVRTLQVTKPALIFLGGAWFVLYLVNRQTASGSLQGRVLLAVTALGLLAGVDAVVELTYLGIPKKEEFLSAGCCLAGSDVSEGSDRFLPSSLLSEGERPWLSALYFGGNAALVLALIGYTLWLRRHDRLPRLMPLLLSAVLALPVSALFLVEIEAPRLLHLPDHHCPYDLIPQAPGAVLGVVLFLWGSFAVGWAWVAGCCARCRESEPFLPATVGQLLSMGLWSYLVSLALVSLELYRA
jgi:hypothetical protein